jgi:signal transduction histidine kinase
MSQVVDALALDYASALEAYVGTESGVALVRAYDLGREYLERGLGLLDLATIHHEALAAVLALPALSGDVTAAASVFLREALGPFEMALRGFQEANQALRARGETLEQHMSTVSHELRTPLTMIQGFTELLLTRSLDPDDAHDAIQHVNRAADRLARLIDDLLSVSRLESERLTLQVVPLDVGAVIGEVARDFQHARRVDVTVEPNLPPVMADRDMLVRILTNLVSNACKYSPQDEPVSVAAARVDDAIRLTVDDRGVGMTEDEVQRVFEKFYRSDSVRHIEGTGLGMFITKQLVERHGGQIWLRSAPGEGTAVHVELPAAT